MTTLSNYALELDATSEIVCAYASGPKTLPASNDSRWIAVGSFKVPTGVRARLEVMGFTTAGTTLSVGLFAPTLDSASLTSVTALSDTPHYSAGVVDLVAGRTYLIAAKADSASVDSAHFGVVRCVSLGLSS